MSFKTALLAINNFFKKKETNLLENFDEIESTQLVVDGWAAVDETFTVTGALDHHSLVHVTYHFNK